MSSPYINVPKTPYVVQPPKKKKTNEELLNLPKPTLSLQPPKTTTPTKQGFSSATDGFSSEGTTTKTPTPIKKSSSGGSSRRSNEQILNTPEPYKNIPSSEVSSSSPQSQTTSNSQKQVQVNKEAYLRSQQNQTQTRSSTLAPEVKVQQNSIVFEPDKRGRYESNVPTTKEEKIDNAFSQARQEFKEQLLTQNNQKADVKKNVITSGKVVGLIGASVIVGGIKGVKSGVNFFIRPDKTIQGLSDTATLLVTNPKELGRQIKTDFLKNPVSFSTEQAVSISTINKVPVVAKNLYVSKGAYAGSVFGKDINIYPTNRKVAVENVLDVSSLETPSYTQSKGIKESVSAFEETKGLVQTSSSAKITGNKVEVVGGKGALGLEDTGIYVNPKGRGSGAPLGVGNGGGYSLNPTKLVDNIFGVPTITEFQTKGVVRYPRSVINTEGFSGVNAFGESISSSGVAIITKRSELAFGEVKPKTYYNEKLGMSKIETGSAELEAVIPVGSQFVEVGNNKFTTYKGRAVKIRKTEVLSKPIIETSKLKVIDASKIMSEQNSFVASYKGGKIPQSVIYPYQKYNSVSSPVDNRMSIASDISSPRVESPSLIDSSNLKTTSSVVTITPSPVPSPTPSKKRGGSSPIIPPVTPSPIIYTPSNSVTTPSVIKYPISKVPIVTRYPVSVVPKKIIYPSKGNMRVKGFDVYVRKQGKFKRINKGALSREEAINFGAVRVGNTASATFKIKVSELAGTETFKQKGFMRDFYSKNNMFIEKRERRIKSSGELTEITFKGIQTNKMKSVFGGKRK